MRSPAPNVLKVSKASPFPSRFTWSRIFSRELRLRPRVPIQSSPPGGHSHEGSVVTQFGASDLLRGLTGSLDSESGNTAHAALPVFNGSFENSVQRRRTKEKKEGDKNQGRILHNLEPPLSSLYLYNSGIFVPKIVSQKFLLRLQPSIAMKGGWRERRGRCKKSGTALREPLDTKNET